jgi:excinuclease ABC subunit A
MGKQLNQDKTSKKEQKKINQMGFIEEQGSEIEQIMIRGAREHNLKNIDIDIPRDKFIVITGVSGSGKSSLAFDTIYAEGQRRYLECLSPYARQFMEVLKKPDVDKVDGLSPAISIEQKTISKNPRSTVGTVTEIYDYLRLLYAKVGIQYCVECNIPVIEKSVDQIYNEIVQDYAGIKIQILAPLVRSRKGHYKDLFANLIREGYSKVRIDGNIRSLIDGMQVERYKIHDVELVVDRLIVNEASFVRLKNSLEIALQMGEQTVMVVGEEVLFSSPKTFSTKYSCPKCGKAYDKLAPNNFSFNSKYGACPVCDGLGEVETFDLDLLVPDKSKSIQQGAIHTLKPDSNSMVWQQLFAFAKLHQIDLNKPFAQLTEEEIRKIFYGDDDDEIEVEHQFAKYTHKYKQKYTGLIIILKNLLENSPMNGVENYLNKYLVTKECDVCHGNRLKQSSLNVYIQGKSISDFVKMDIDEAYEFALSLTKVLNKREKEITKIILKEIADRLNFLKNVGLNYLTLHRSSRTLSGGESQRIRLASQIGSQLVGVTYVLDEPSIGLHQYDNHLLIKSLKELRDLGNTVIVVEHDKSMIMESDYFVDIGPKAGVHGGNIIFQGNPKNLNKIKRAEIENSLTVQYLLNQKQIEAKYSPREGNGNYLILRGAKGNNLQNVTLELPLGKFICITGLSGSGKSSLINDTLFPILSNKFNKTNLRVLPYESIEGIENIDKVIEIDQSPIGKTARSNPATYTGLFTQIRNFFAMLPEAKIRGYSSGRFSFNVAGGRCEDCQGAGLKKIEMNFLPDIYVPCETCQGKRYNDETLQVKYKHLSIADILELTIEESVEIFSELPLVKRKLQTLKDVGLGYIKLGQQSPTLSGGESQRVKLATELSKRSTGKTLYLLDEPTTGLHFDDVRVLVNMLDDLVKSGNTVVVVEHNLDVVKFADWIIDLGPLGGRNGGKIIATGPPLEIIKNKKSLTGKYLIDEFSL